MKAEAYEALDPKCQMFIDEYDAKREDLMRLKDTVLDAIRKTVRESGVVVTAIDGRVKERNSLIGKLLRKGHKYNSLSDITDLVGVRIITLFGDDVDKVATFMSRLFHADWTESVDKRTVHELTSFGYNSLHYVVSIPKTMCANNLPESLCSVRFEIQMRSTLQHAWAEMEHDIGYKSKVGTPPEYQRMLGRLAGMLELCDEEFERIRVSVADYRRRMEALIDKGKLSEVPLNEDTFAKYVEMKPFDRLTRRIASINQGEIREMTLMPFLPLLLDIGLHNLQDVEDFVKENENDAYLLAMRQLADVDIDIVSSTVALQNLVLVHALKSGGGVAGLTHIYDLLNGSSVHNRQLAEFLYRQVSALPFMNRFSS
mgnify:CR=1 FL=1